MKLVWRIFFSIK